MKLSYKYIIYFSILLLNNCASQAIVGVFDFKKQDISKGNSKEISRSKYAINGTDTFEKYFILNSKEVFIKVEIIGIKKTKGIKTREISVPLYLILDRGIDSTNFNPKIPYTFSEIYRNYDDNWDLIKDNIIKNNQSDPIQKLTPGIYRIRFCSPNQKEFTYKLSISTDNGIRYYDKMPNKIDIANAMEENKKNDNK